MLASKWDWVPFRCYGAEALCCYSLTVPCGRTVPGDPRFADMLPRADVALDIPAFYNVIGFLYYFADSKKSVDTLPFLLTVWKFCGHAGWDAHFVGERRSCACCALWSVQVSFFDADIIQDIEAYQHICQLCLNEGNLHILRYAHWSTHTCTHTASGRWGKPRMIPVAALSVLLLGGETEFFGAHANLKLHSPSHMICLFSVRRQNSMFPWCTSIPA